MSHSTVVSRDSVRMSLPVAALNDLDILRCNVQNAFLSADNLEKHHLIAGDEFGHERGEDFRCGQSIVWPQISQRSLQVLHG